MHGNWYSQFRGRLQSAWEVLTGRAYAAYTYPDHMPEVRLRIVLVTILGVIANRSFIDTSEIRPLVESALEDDPSALTAA